jgi:Ca2+-binding EF-hand superfamily protein
MQRGLPSPLAMARAASSAAASAEGEARPARSVHCSAIEEEQCLKETLKKIAMLLQTRGVHLRDCFQDCERSDATSLMTPRFSGKVTTAQFRQHFPFMREIGEEEVEMLIKHYGVGDIGREGCSGAVHFAALDNDVREFDVQPSAGMMISPLPIAETPRTPRRALATPMKPTFLDVLEKIRAVTTNRRAIMSGSAFLEFDRLRRGVCKIHNVKPVLSVLRIELDDDDFHALAERYSNTEGLFRYREFCRELAQHDVVLPATPGSLNTPRAATPVVISKTESSRPHVQTPSPTTGPYIDARLHDIEMHIRKDVQSRRLMLRNVFQDFDRTRNGRVTQNQFARIMAMNSIKLSDEDVALLCEIYGDNYRRNGVRDTTIVNVRDFRYLDFCAAVDIRAADSMTSSMLTSSQFPGPSKYFDRRGRIVPSPVISERAQSVELRGSIYGRPATR